MEENNCNITRIMSEKLTIIIFSDVGIALSLKQIFFYVIQNKIREFVKRRKFFFRIKTITWSL
jgi:hypothetical protein